MISVESVVRASRYKKLSRRTLCDVASDERALVQRLQNGDEAAFVEVVENYHSRLLRFAAGLVGSWAAAEDVDPISAHGDDGRFDAVRGRTGVND